MNLGGEFLSRVLLILAVFFGPPLVLAITAGLLARWRQSAAAVVWTLAALVLAGALIAGPTRDSGWVAGGHSTSSTPRGRR